MKLFGSSKRSKHTTGHAHEAQKPETGRGGKRVSRKKKMTVKKGILIALCAVAAFAAVLAVGVGIFLKTQMKPPSTTGGLNDPNKGGPTTPVDTGEPGDTVATPPDTSRPSAPTEPADTSGQQEIRPEGVYTVLVAARDVAGANTDALMVAKFDTRDYSLKVVSIPRDTLVNVTYRSKKVNAMYAYGGEEGLVEGITDMVGFEPDFYAIIKLKAISKLIDDIGGVDYYVPQNMDYDDEAQNLHIHFKKGMTHMTGQKAVEYMRFRKGYSDADIGRINAQHEFLTTMVKQILANKSKVNITSLVDIFFNDVKTDLTTGECTWLAKELLKMNSENISFYTMPGNYNDYVKGSGYVTIALDEWIDMINETINPFNVPVTSANLDVIGRDANGKLVTTTGKYADESWAKGIGTSTTKPSSTKPSSTTPPSTTPPDTTPPETDPPETVPPEDTEPPAGTDTPPEDTEPPAGIDTPLETEPPADTEAPPETEPPADTEAPPETEPPADTEPQAEPQTTPDTQPPSENGEGEQDPA